MTCIYIHYMASVVIANSFFWPEYTFKKCNHLLSAQLPVWFPTIVSNANFLDPYQQLLSKSHFNYFVSDAYFYLNNLLQQKM